MVTINLLFGMHYQLLPPIFLIKGENTTNSQLLHQKSPKLHNYSELMQKIKSANLVGTKYNYGKYSLGIEVLTTLHAIYQYQMARQWNVH